MAANQKLTRKHILKQNKLLRAIPSFIGPIDLGPYQIELLDIHIHLPEFKNSVVHSHGHFEISPVINNSAFINVGKSRILYKKGQFTFTRPGIEHSWHTEADDFLMYVLACRLTESKQTKSSNPELRDLGKLCDPLFSTTEFVFELPENFENDIGQILSELSNTNLGFKTVISAVFKNMFINFTRCISKDKHFLHSTLEPSPTDDQIVKLIDQFLRDNITSTIELDTIAKIVCKSKRSITRHYRRKTGVTIGEKLKQLRIFKAQMLLEKNDIPIKEVAFRCGIPDVAYFCKQFKKAFSCSPTEFRKANS